MEFSQVQRHEADDVADVVAFMTADAWPFHTEPGPDGEDRLGIVRLLDLDDGTPLFGLRVRASARGRGAWPGPDRLHDRVGYAILRRDWETGTVTPVDWAA